MITAREAQHWAETKRNDACSWWVDRIRACEQMPNKAGVVLYPPCVLVSVFANEFKVEMIGCLGTTRWEAPADHRHPKEFGLASW